MRAPPEARPSRGRAASRAAPEALRLGAPGIPGTENCCLAFRKGVPSLVLSAFLGPRVDLGQGRAAAAAFISGSPAGAHAHLPRSRARGWCPSPARSLPWHRGPRGGRGAVTRDLCLLAPLCGCGWSPGTLGGVTEFVRGFQNKKLKKTPTVWPGSLCLSDCPGFQQQSLLVTGGTAVFRCWAQSGHRVSSQDK